MRKRDINSTIQVLPHPPTFLLEEAGLWGVRSTELHWDPLSDKTRRINII
jgi:hypothetical protein